MADIQLDEMNDLQVVDGDFKIDDSFSQEVRLIVASCPGNWKSDPVIGCDMYETMNEEGNLLNIETILKRHLKRDGKDLKKIELGTDNGIKLIFDENT